ncbi:ADP-ribosylglycohydrolase family protein, partial [Thermodesulfobacteriota bacterium]
MGTILGALGAPFEGRTRGHMLKLHGLTKGYEKITGYPIGQYTDDTQMTLALTESIILKKKIDGQDIANRFASLWRNNTIIGGGACRDAMMNIIVREASFEESGVEIGRAGNGSAMRTSPIGLFDSDDLMSLKADAITQSTITHNDNRASAGAATVSLAIYY